MQGLLTGFIAGVKAMQRADLFGFDGDARRDWRAGLAGQAFLEDRRVLRYFGPDSTSRSSDTPAREGRRPAGGF